MTPGSALRAVSPVLSRVETIAASASPSSSDIYAQYTYLGASTIVQVAHPAVDGNLVLSYGTGGTYAGWDRFGRVVQQTWTVDGSAVDSYAYGYDLNSNRLYRENLKTSNFDELYSYDGLNRLEEMNRGNLDGSKLFLTSTAFGQAWTLDQLGNWTGFDDDGTAQTRTHNAVNEITDISNWADPAYDAAGNMIRGPKPGSTSDLQHYKYDAWNRLTGVYADDAQDPGNPGTRIMTYTHDGLNRLAVSHDNFYYHYYYNEQWQTLEVRKNNPADGDPERQYVWDIRYIDAPVVRFFDGNLDGDYADQDDNVLYYCNDANMNVTALVDASDGSVVERYAYTAYGKAIVLNPDTWAERQNGSVVKNWHLFAGYRFDDETGLYLVRNRVYQAELGRWVQRDPAEYHDGLNLLQYLISSPNVATDPFGLGAGAGIEYDGFWNQHPKPKEEAVDVSGSIYDMVMDWALGDMDLGIPDQTGKISFKLFDMKKKVPGLPPWANIYGSLSGSLEISRCCYKENGRWSDKKGIMWTLSVDITGHGGLGVVVPIAHDKPGEVKQPGKGGPDKQRVEANRRKWREYLKSLKQHNSFEERLNRIACKVKGEIPVAPLSNGIECKKGLALTGEILGGIKAGAGVWLYYKGRIAEFKDWGFRITMDKGEGGVSFELGAGAELWGEAKAKLAYSGVIDD